jgi:GntR family transcriptional regulator
MSIILGELQNGEPLPSVRDLAASLGVALVTVTRAYSDLQQQGLIRSVPRRGYYVSIDLDEAPNQPSLTRFRTLILHALKEASDAGLSFEQVMRVVHTEVRSLSSRPILVAVAGQRNAALLERVRVVQDSLSDLPARVIGLPFEDVDSGMLPAGLESLDDVDWFLVPVGEASLASKILNSFPERVVLMTRTLRDDVREFISTQPPTTLFGVIAGHSSLIPRILDVMRRYHPLKTQPIVTALDHPVDEIHLLLSRVDALIIGSLAIDQIRPRLDPCIPQSELVYVPDKDTLARLRQKVEQPR